MDSHMAPVSLQVSSGTVLDVLNQLVLMSDHSMWIAHCGRVVTAETSGQFGQLFQLRNAEMLTAEVESARAVPPVR